MNIPTKTKLARGRSPIPQPVKIFKDDDGRRFSSQSLAEKFRPPPSKSPERSPSKPREQIGEWETVKSALEAIPSDDRGVWLHVGMSLHSTQDARARELWDEWSRSSTKFDEADQETTWRSFRFEHGAEAVTLGTLYHLAREHGWKGSREAPPDMQWRFYGKSRMAMAESGLWLWPVPTRKGQRTTPFRFAPPFKIIGLCRDPKGGGWGRLIAFADPDGNQKELVVTGDELQCRPSDIAGRLCKSGLNFLPEHAAAAIAYIAGQNPTQRVSVVARTGWHEIEGRPVFVLPEEIIGATDGIPVRLGTSESAAYAAKGTLEDWQREVAKPAGEHRLLALSLSTALAGPLLFLIDGELGGVHLKGNSSTGKTTALGVAASVWGKGSAKNGYVIPWRATANGLEGVAALHSDTVLGSSTNCRKLIQETFPL